MPAPALAAVLVAAVLLLPLLLGRTYFEMDLSFIDVGHLCALRPEGLAGAGSSLSGLIGNGAPVAGHPSFQTFYPPRAFARLFSPDVGAAFVSVLHLIAGAAATARLGRAYGLRRWAAMAAGVLFALSGPAVELISRSDYVVAATWLPLAWCSARLALKGGGAQWTGLWAASLALLLLGGEPQAFGIALVVGLGEVAARALQARKAPAALSRVKGRSLAVVVGGLGALLVGWLQWGPTLALTALSRRASGLSGEEALTWSFTPELWPGLLLPGVLRTEVQPGVLWPEIAAGVVGPAAPWASRPFFGGLLLVAALIGAVRWNKRGPLLVAVVGGLAALGSSTPVMPLLVAIVPGLSSFRYPAKLLVVTALALALLAGWTLDRLQRDPALRRLMLIAGGLLALVELGLLVSQGAWGPVLDAAAATTKGAVPPPIPLETASALVATGWVRTLLPLVVGLVMLAPPRARPWIFIVPVLELIGALPDEVETGPGLVEVEGPMATMELDAEGLPPVLCVPDTVASIVVDHPVEGTRWASMFARRIWGFPEWPACDEVATPVSYTEPMRTRTSKPLYEALSAARPQAAVALGCTHVVEHRADWPLTGPPITPPRPEVPPLLSPIIRRSPTPIPPAFVIEQPRLVDERQVVAEVMAGESAEQVLAVLDDPTGQLSAGAPLPQAAEVKVSSSWPRRDEVHLTIAGTGGAVVGVRTSYYLGWQAEQGGRALHVVRVAGGQVGVVVDDVAAGEVVLRYQLPRKTSASLAAVIGAVLALLGAVLARRSTRRQRPAARNSAMEA